MGRGKGRSNKDEKRWVLRNSRGGYFKNVAGSKWTITMASHDATRFAKTSAENILFNCIPKDQLENWFIVDAVKAKSGLTLAESIEAKRGREEDLIIQSAPTSDNEDLLSIIPERFRGDIDWMFIARDIVDLRKDLIQYQQVLMKLQAQNHREETDIRHKIELGKKPNVVQGYQLLMQYRENLIMRRKIKNDLLRVDALLMPEKDHLSGEVTRKVSAIENQVYHPRALRDLFEDEDFIERKDEGKDEKSS